MVKNAYKAKLKHNLDNCVGQRKKLRTYAEFKETVNFEKYLEIITNFAIRKSLTHFRLGVHDLEIECGLFKCKPLSIEARTCKLCFNLRIQAVENEKHFLLHCPDYNAQRSNLFAKLSKKFPNISISDDNIKFSILMSQEDPECKTCVSSFIFASMKSRKKESKKP